MTSSAKRVISTMLTAVVFVATINCVCHAVPIAASAVSKSCCGADAKHHSSDKSMPQHDAKCVHCQRSMMSDTLAGKQLIASFDFCCFTAADAVHVPGETQTALVVIPMPPAIGSATLLSLHCALMT